MEFRERVERHVGRLSPADHRLLHALLERPTEAAFASAEMTASWANVHAATAVRLAKKLGYEGYPQLRAAIQKDLVGHLSAGPASEPVGADGDGSGRMTAFFEAEAVAGVRALSRHLPDALVDSAVTHLRAARRVYVFGYAEASVPASVLERGLQRAGVDAAALKGSSEEIAARLTGLRAEDVFVAVSLGDRHRTLRPLLEYAQPKEVVTIVVADARGPLLRPRPTVLLAAPRPEADGYRSLVVPMAICDGLAFAVAMAGEAALAGRNGANGTAGTDGAADGGAPEDGERRGGEAGMDAATLEAHLSEAMEGSAFEPLGFDPRDLLDEHLTSH